MSRWIEWLVDVPDESAVLEGAGHHVGGPGQGDAVVVPAGGWFETNPG